MFDNKQRLGYKLNILKCAWFAHYFFLFKNVIAKSHKTTRANMIRQNMRNRYELIGKSFFIAVIFMSTIKTAVEAFYLNKNIPSASICIVLFLASNIIYDINLFIMKKKYFTFEYNQNILNSLYPLCGSAGKDHNHTQVCNWTMSRQKRPFCICGLTWHISKRHLI